MVPSDIRRIDVWGLLTRLVLVAFFVFLVLLALENDYMVAVAFYLIAAVLTLVVIFGTKLRKEIHNVRYHTPVEDT